MKTRQIGQDRTAKDRTGQDIGRQIMGEAMKSMHEGRETLACDFVFRTPSL